jgi:hypothetical protein
LSQSENELPFQVKEMLAWMTIARLLRHVDGPLRVVESNPGGGHYRCLNLVRPDGELLVSLNLAGESALARSEWVPHVWEVAGRTAGLGPDSLAQLLIRSGRLPQRVEDLQSPSEVGAVAIATWLISHARSDVAAVPVWHGQGEYGDVAEDAELLSRLDPPAHWLLAPGPVDGMTASGWLIALVRRGKPVGAVNLRSGQKRMLGQQPAIRVPEVFYDEAGDYACPVAMQVSFRDADGQKQAQGWQWVSFAESFARNQRQEGFDVTVEPLFEVPEGFEWEHAGSEAERAALVAKMGLE